MNITPTYLAAMLTELQLCCDKYHRRRMGEFRLKPKKGGISHTEPNWRSEQKIWAGPAWYYGCQRD